MTRIVFEDDVVKPLHGCATAVIANPFLVCENNRR